jgi:hypothetical protein
MPILDLQSLLLPVLQTLSDGHNHHTKEIQKRMGTKFKVTRDELRKKHKNGNARIRQPGSLGARTLSYGRGSERTYQGHRIRKKRSLQNNGIWLGNSEGQPINSHY